MHAKNVHIQGPQIHQFNNIAPNPIPRSVFKRDHTRRTTFDAGYLVPIFVDEILPGDSINIKMTSLCRMATPIKPVMENIYLETFGFFVPFRLTWANWKKFQGEQINPGDSVAYTIPGLDSTKAPLSTTGFTIQSVFDYLGMPTLVTNVGSISALYNRGYDLIWNEWFRDENLQNSLVVPNGDGPDDPSIYQLRKRNKRKDYFTSCNPWPQKGNPVTINVGGVVPVTGAIATNSTPPTFTGGGATNWNLEAVTAGLTVRKAGANFSATGNVQFGNQSGLNLLGASADLATASGITINALRQSALYQQILELDARGGTRYVESIFARFGVVSPDFRLQRPELIGQGSSPINVYAIPQTAPTMDGETPQGNLAAYAAQAISGGHQLSYSATEHGMVIWLANVRADLTYQQGLPRMFQRRTRLDFYEPLLNGLGEQSVLRKEIMATGTADDEFVFGYQERFADYRFKNSEITGMFRSTAPAPIDFWHLSQEFATQPVLGSSFITEDPPMDRILAVTTEPDFLMDCHFSYTHVRPMPIRSNPGIDKL